MTAKMRAALALVLEHGIDRYGEHPGNRAPITSDETQLVGDIPYINFRTAAALERAGVAATVGWGEDAEIVLVTTWSGGAADQP